MPIKRLILLLVLWLGLVPFAAAQPATFPHHLLALLPDDFAICLVMHDLRGNAARWEQSAWLKKFRQSPLGKAYLDSPEARQLENLQSELKKHLDLDWPTLRNEILGDTLILSYSPGPKDEERGLFLLHLRNPDRLNRLIKQLNKAQIAEGKVKVSDLVHNGVTYHRRVEGSKTQYYIVKDSLAAATSNEAIMKAFLARQASPPRDNPWKKRFERSGADAAFVTLCVNPRMLDAEILQSKKKDDPFPGYWKALDAIFVTGSIRADAEARIVIQANVNELPDWARGAFTHTTETSPLWQRFPEESILTIATKTEFTGLVDALKLVMPPEDRKKLEGFKEYLPVIGPDWGVCVLPSKDASQLPPALFALALQAGPKQADQTLVKTLEGFLELGVQAHNQKNPDAKLEVKTVMQEKVAVKYLSGEKVFPPGLQPAWALKDGFLLVATSPEAIRSFRTLDKQAALPKDAPMVRISAPELARLLEHRRKHILASVTDKDAEKNLNNVIAFLNLFDRLTFGQQGEAGQATWTIRLSPAVNR